MKPLTPEEIQVQTQALPEWQLVGDEIRREYAFADFIQAMTAVNTIAMLAEDVEHHPDIDIRYNKVRLALTTHDAGGLTQKDFDLAQSIEDDISPQLEEMQ